MRPVYCGIAAHAEESSRFKFPESNYSVPHNHIIVLASKTSAIIIRFQCMEKIHRWTKVFRDPLTVFLGTLQQLYSMKHAVDDIIRVIDVFFFFFKADLFMVYLFDFVASVGEAYDKQEIVREPRALK